MSSSKFISSTLFNSSASLRISSDSTLEISIILLLPCKIKINKTQKIKHTLITFLSARGEDYSQIAGFNAGADDYITKPFSMRELMARISSQLRRMKMNVDVKNSKSEEIIKLADRVIIDKLKREVIVDGNNIDLRAREFDLFAYLSSSPGRVFTREQLLKDVWGFDYIGDTRTVDVHIRWLRSKIENSSQKAIIGTVRAVGLSLIHI